MFTAAKPRERPGRPLWRCSRRRSRVTGPGKRHWVLAGVVGLAIALVLGERVAAASLHLGGLAQQIGEDGAAVPSAAGPAVPGASSAAGPSELVRLAADLDAALTRLAETREQAAAAED